jgi:crotonobetainyl-CoA:carnitine CoA-transferase CaiB-like acyl-CoA transferase
LHIGIVSSYDSGCISSAPNATMSLPLADVTILAVEQFGAGPWSTLQLADLGARVIKIEDPVAGGDIGRYVPPFQEGEDSLFFETLNRNKQSVSLDLRHASGRTAFEDLVKHADAVFSNLRGDQPEKLRLRFVDLAEANPRIVCCSLSGFGMTGPRAATGGYDYVMQGLAGWMSLTGEPGGAPTKTGLSLVDLSGGYVAAIALLGGLWRARRDGIGCDCDVSLFETALAELVYIATWVASAGYEPGRTANSAHPSIVPFQNFETRDGWIVVACAKPKFWTLLCTAIERPELEHDPRFASFADRDRNRRALLKILDGLFLDRTTTEWLDLFERAGIPAGRVNTVSEALEDPQALARDAVVEIPHPRFGAVRQIATPLRVGVEAAPLRRAPLRGEDTAAVLRDLCGYSDARIAALRSGGAFGDEAPSASRRLRPESQDVAGAPT